MTPAPHLSHVAPELVAATLQRFCRTPRALRDYRDLPDLARAAGATVDEATLVFIRLVAMRHVFADRRWRPYALMMRTIDIADYHALDSVVVRVIASAPMREDATFSNDDIFARLLAGIVPVTRA